MRKSMVGGTGALLLLSALSLANAREAPAGRALEAVVTIQANGSDGARLKGVKKLTRVAQLTGQTSINRTDRFGVAGTDLGIMVEMQGKVYMAFGDTFATRPKNRHGGGGEGWRSNVMAVSADASPADGITFDSMILGRDGKARELIASKKDKSEITVIPTGGCGVGEKLYLSFMSVRKWGARGVWETNYGGLARSDDQGRTWSKLEGVRWPSDSGFTQAALAKNDGEIFFISTPPGRHGPARLMKVAESLIEDMSRYVFFAGLKGDVPTWSPRLQDAAEIIPAPVGELSLLRNDPLDRWYATYLNERSRAIEIRESRHPWGPWSEPVALVSEAEYPGLYGAFMLPRYVEQGGRAIYFAMSQWGPYNVFWMRAELEIE